MEQFELLEKNMLSQYFCEIILNSPELPMEIFNALLRFSPQQIINVLYFSIKTLYLSEI